MVVISNHTTEVTSSSQDGTAIAALQVLFYVALPGDAERAPYRETNYVIPRATLSEIVSQDGVVIQAVVRNSLSPLLTHSVAHVTDVWQVVGIVFSVAFSVLLFALLIAVSIKVVFKITER